MVSSPHRCATQKRLRALVVVGFWMLCPRCSRRCRVLFFGFGKVACRRCFRLRYHSQTMDRIGRAQHAMRKIAKQLDPEVDVGLRPPGMHWSRYNRLAERFEHQSDVWNITMMRRLGMLVPR